MGSQTTTSANHTLRAPNASRDHISSANVTTVRPATTNVLRTQPSCAPGTPAAKGPRTSSHAERRTLFRRAERAARAEARGAPGVPLGGGGAALPARSTRGVDGRLLLGTRPGSSATTANRQPRERPSSAWFTAWAPISRGAIARGKELQNERTHFVIDRRGQPERDPRVDVPRTRAGRGVGFEPQPGVDGDQPRSRHDELATHMDRRWLHGRPGGARPALRRTRRPPRPTDVAARRHGRVRPRRALSPRPRRHRERSSAVGSRWASARR